MCHARGSNPCGCLHEPLVSYRINRQVSGWILPPLMIRAFGAHCQGRHPTAVHVERGGPGVKLVIAQKRRFVISITYSAERLRNTRLRWRETAMKTIAASIFALAIIAASATAIIMGLKPQYATAAAELASDTPIYRTNLQSVW
jgi:hypothetical protein